MSFTVTLHLWWLWAWLAVGAVLWLPIEWWGYRQIGGQRPPFWRDLWRAIRAHPLRLVVPIVAWPLAVWEVVPWRRWLRR